MCGIVGYIGKGDAKTILIKGLERLEYRGYDSAGIALMDKNNLSVYKKLGRVSELTKFLKNKTGNNVFEGAGIAHTRWATHGIPSDLNAHPHLSNDGTIAIVHNGIIENYLSLKKVLINKGYKFKSETDTEVLANLIEDIKKNAKIKRGMSIDEAVRLALEQVIGAYAILVISKDDPDTMVIAKLSSPAVIGIGNGEFFIASDATPIIEHTKKVVYLEDGEMAIISKEKNKKLSLKIKNIKKNAVFYCV